MRTKILGKTEIGADGLLLNVVTGGGKTAVIAALIEWLRIAHERSAEVRFALPGVPHGPRPAGG